MPKKWRKYFVDDNDIRLWMIEESQELPNTWRRIGFMEDEEAARLTIAAPDLLEMLIEAANELDGIMDCKGHTSKTRDIRDRSYAAIAKAKDGE